MPVLQLSETLFSKSRTKGPLIYSILNIENGHKIEQTIPSLSSAADAEEIRWYLEDFAVKDCFAKGRADKAVILLQRMGTILVSAIDWEKVLDPSDINQPLAIHVDQSTTTSERHTFWELLEQHDLWPSSIRPSVVEVSRTSVVVPAAEPIQPKASAVFNILVCAARLELDDDIPHRLVSRNILEVSPPNVHIAIVRPGTFLAFRNCLQEKEAGHFNLVHFDLHGIEDASGKVSLGFLKTDEEGNIEPHLISAQEIGQLLHRHGVHQVILNACRSARGSSAETNIAMGLLQAGISTIVAMSYSIADRAVEIFTKSLYAALFHHKCNLSEAARLSRRAMSLNPKRISRFGDEIEILDFCVPVTYRRTSISDVEMETSSIAKLAVEEMDFSSRFPYGREDDILHLESLLLIVNMPVLLHGQAGIGKTSLLQHLRQWWKLTGLIQDSLVIQLYKENFETAGSLFIRLHRYFLGAKKYSGPEAIINHLHENPCFIGLDALESMSTPASTTLRKQRIEFKKVIKSIQGGKTLIIIASRRKEGWLSEHVRSHHLRCLHIMAGLEQISHILVGAAQLLNIPSYDSPQEKQYFEQIIKLVDCNPLAIRLLTQDFLGSCKSVKQYFFDLLGGAATTINWREAEELEGLRSLDEIHQLSEDLSPKSLGDGFIPHVMASFWKTIPTAEFHIFVNLWNSQTAKTLGGSSRRDRISGFKDLVASLSAQKLGMTQEFQSLFDLVCQLSDETQTTPETPINLPSVESLLLLWDEFEIGTDFPFQHLVHAACNKIIKTFKGASFLEDIETDALSPHLQSKNFMTIHPLLPIVFRSYSFYRSNQMNFTDGITTAFSLFYAYRSKRWPWEKIYFHTAWEQPRKELHLEFYNFCSAAEIALRKEDTEGEVAALQQAVINRLLVVLPRGALRDPSRVKIAADLSERALNIMMKQIEHLEGAGRTNTSSKAPSDLEDDALKLLNSRSSAVAFASQLLIHYQRLQSPKANYFLNIILRVVDDLKFEGVPAVLSSYSSRLMTTFAYTKELLIAYTDTSRNLEEMWNMRQQYLQIQAQEPGLESFGLATQQHSWQDIQIDILAPLATQAHIFTSVIQAREAIKGGNLSQARKIVDKAFMDEINRGGNDDMNKALLIDIRSTIDEKEGKWDDALRHCDQAYMLEQSARGGEGNPASEKQWNLRRDKLLKRCWSDK